MHERAAEGDERLRDAVEATIETLPEPIRRRASRVLATQRDDPVAAMRAAWSLTELGEPQFLPRWTPDATLAEIAFRVHMAGAVDDVLPSEFVSSRGMTVRQVVHADRSALESFKPPQETVKNLSWARDAEFPAPWDAASHFDATAKRTKCSQDGTPEPRCRSEVDGTVTLVGFEVQAGGGFKVRSVETQIDFPDCML